MKRRCVESNAASRHVCLGALNMSAAWSHAASQPERDGIRNVCYGACYKPGGCSTGAAHKTSTAARTAQDKACACACLATPADGTQMVAGIGSMVIIYDAVDGDVLHTLKGHKASH